MIKTALFSILLVTSTAFAADPDPIVARVSASDPLVVTCKDEKGQAFNVTAKVVRFMVGEVFKVKGTTSGGEEILEIINAAKNSCSVEPNYIVKAH